MADTILGRATWLQQRYSEHRKVLSVVFNWRSGLLDAPVEALYCKSNLDVVVFLTCISIHCTMP